MAYYSWECPDLGGATLYCSDYIWNPDAYEFSVICPLERPYGFDIFDFLDPDLAHAIASNTDYDSGILKMARWSVGGATTNYYFQLRFVFTHDSTLDIRYGYGDGSSYTQSEVWSLTRSQFAALESWERRVYFLRRLIRSNYLYEGMPNYDGTYDHIMVIGPVRIYVGTWDDAYGQYGRMEYTPVSDHGDLSSVLLSIPCATDNKISRSEQSEGICRAIYMENLYSSSDLGSHLGDYTGHYNDDPDNPYEGDPNDKEEGGPPYGPGYGGSGGGTGNHILPDEDIPVPSLPSIGAASVSWLHLFKMDESDISAFGNDLVQATNWQAIQAYFSDPLDAIIGINLVPVSVATSGQRTPVIGSFSWSRAFDVVSEEFYELDCGTIEIPPYWDSAFDMNPYTKIFIHLPFVGTRELNADEIMGATLGVIYHVDVCTGDCVAFVTKSAPSGSIYGPIKSQVVAQFNGNCAVRVPTGRISQDAAIGAAMSLLGQAAHVGGAIAGAAFGAPETIAAAQVATQVSSATMTAVNGGKTKVERSGSLAAAAGYMGILKPYIIRAVPQQVLPDNYQMLEGYPVNKAASLSQLQGTGLNTVEAIRLTGFTGYDSEQEELISILQGGVIV